MDSILGSVFGPQNGGRFVGKIVVTERKKAQVSIVSSCTRQKFPIPLGFQGFAAPRVLVLHTLRTLMSTHVLELGRPSVADTGFASVFGPQNEGHKFTRKCNLTLDTSMAKPTPKPLLRMVEREEYSECLGASVERPV